MYNSNLQFVRMFVNSVYNKTASEKKAPRKKEWVQKYTVEPNLLNNFPEVNLNQAKCKF